MPDPLPRWVVALTLIVAVFAISLGIKDYVEHKKAAPPESAPTVADASAVNHPKKTTSSKARRAQLSATTANARGTAQGGADGMGKALIADESAQANRNTLLMMGAGGPNTLRDQATKDEADATVDGNFRALNQLDATATSGCLPLPNLTKPGDVDAPYYENWARTYCGGSP
jgi:hypothetical protein